MPFRLNARNFFLTYSRCDVLPELLLEHFVDRYPRLRFARVARETHEDGGFHLHALLKFATKHDCRNEREFDFEEHHPKIEASRNFGKSLHYITKDGEYCDYSEEDFNLDERDDIPEPEDFESQGLFLRECLRQHIPFGYAQQFWKLSVAPDRHLRSNTYPGTVTNTILSSFAPARGASTVLVGPSGIGKTSAAIKSLPTPILLASHIDDLRHLSGDTQSIVFDDMDFQHWPRTAQIHLVDTDLPRSINVRYGTVGIPAHMTKVFTANTFPFTANDEAILRRLTIIDLN